MTTVTLINGREVDDSSEEWRLECLQRHRHVQNLLDLARLGQREGWKGYVATVREREGAEAAERLKAAFAKAWEAQQEVKP